MPQVTASPSPDAARALGREERLEELGEVLARDAAPVVLDAHLHHWRCTAVLPCLPPGEVAAGARAPTDRLVVRAANCERRSAAALARAVGLDERDPAARAGDGRDHAFLARLGRDVTEAAVHRVEAEAPFAAAVFPEDADRRQAADACAGIEQVAALRAGRAANGLVAARLRSGPDGWRVGSCRRARRARRRR